MLNLVMPDHVLHQESKYKKTMIELTELLEEFLNGYINTYLDRKWPNEKSKLDYVEKIL